MSRVIKFRVWDGEKMITDNVVYLGDGSFAIQRDSLDWDFDFAKFGKPELIGMQFTGLTDKNGVEIYEGDILALVFHDEFHNDSVSIEDGEHYCNVNVHWDGDGYWMFSENNSAWYFPQSLNECATYAVIGNIHQNPELIGE